MDTNLTSISTFGWFSDSDTSDNPFMLFGWYDTISTIIGGPPEIVFRDLFITRATYITFER